jgi:hypothetical protein
MAEANRSGNVQDRSTVGTVLLFRDEEEAPRSQVALANGDLVQLVLDGKGLTLSRLGPSASETAILFQASAEIVSAICAGLLGPKRVSNASPLQILTAAVQRIGSADGARSAFEAAAAALE